MPQVWYTCLAAECEGDDFGRKAFIHEEKAEEHKDRTGHGYEVRFRS